MNATTTLRTAVQRDEGVLVHLLAEVARMQHLIHDELAARGTDARVVTHERFRPRVTDAEQRVLTELCRPILRDDSLPIAATNQQIADVLCLSLAGVKSHIRSLFDKFAIDDLPQNRKRAALAHRAIQLGSVAPDQAN